MMTTAPLMNIAEVARLLCISRSTVRRLVQRGELRCVRVGGSVRFALVDVDALIGGRRLRTASDEACRTGRRSPQDERPAGKPGAQRTVDHGDHRERA
jgi:excisionase family DNA binding protein